MKPFTLKPFYKETIWGGNHLRELFGKEIPFEKTGETWEVSTRPEGTSTVVFDGKEIPFDIFFEAHKKEIMGEGFEGDFPLLLKLIDANDKLSVQVHPNDENSKTEMWCVLSAKENASLICGFNRDITKNELKEKAENGTLEECMNFVPVKKGDSFFIPAGLVHAIGEGIVIMEVQQNSDTTYRLYDYNRGREIHVDKAVSFADLSRYEKQKFPENCLAKCEFFDVERAELPTKLKGFAIIFAKDEDVKINELEVKKGGFAIIPNGESAKISGKGEIIYVTL